HGRYIKIWPRITPAGPRTTRRQQGFGLGTAAASLCVTLVAVGVTIGRGNDTGCTHAAAPLATIRSLLHKRAGLNANTRPTTAPPTRNHQMSAPGGFSELRARPRAVAQPKRSGSSLSAKVLLGNLISGW